MKNSLLGLFGGTSFYDCQVCMRFLPVQEAVLITKLAHRSLGGVSCSHPRSTAHGTSTANDPDAGTPIEDCVVFSTSSVGQKKLYLLSCDRIPDGLERLKSGSVFVTNSSWGLTPCHPPSTPEDTQGPLLQWLGEYLRRLESGIYQFRPMDQSGPPSKLDLCRLIAHYPMTPFHNPSGVPTASSSATETATETETGSHDSLNIGATRCVTRNVEVTASPCFIPEKSDPSQHHFFWSYSIQLRQLKAGEEGFDPAASIGSSQLSSRHFRVHEPAGEDEGEGEGHTEVVDGDGVIGLFPLLGGAGSENR